MKTSELIGPALDWAVAKCEGLQRDDPEVELYVFQKNHENYHLQYSTEWAQGGPIIEREGIELLCNLTATEASRFSSDIHADWQAFYRHRRRTEERSFAHTPLIAAMRCFVASKLGDEVDVPEDLV